MTCEFIEAELLQKELLGEKKPPTWDELINLIPKKKLIILEEV